MHLLFLNISGSAADPKLKLFLSTSFCSACFGKHESLMHTYTLICTSSIWEVPRRVTGLHQRVEPRYLIFAYHRRLQIQVWELWFHGHLPHPIHKFVRILRRQYFGSIHSPIKPLVLYIPVSLPCKHAIPTSLLPVRRAGR